MPNHDAQAKQSSAAALHSRTAAGPLARPAETKPNFLIIGAARGGTTLLYHLIRRHPQVFLSTPKELRFFAKEGAPDFRGPGDESLNRKWVATWEDYCRHFSDSDGALAVGEASPFYLCSEEAPRLIHGRLPDVKLIAVLREPVSRAFSAFMYMRRSGREPLTDFAAALEAEERRRKDNWEYLWHYRTLGLYSAQIERYLELFPREHMWIGLYDDLERDAARFIKEVFSFLGVDDSYEAVPKSRVNASGEPRWRQLQRLVDGQNAVRAVARRLMPKSLRRVIRVAVTERNLRRDAVPEDVERELRAFYRPDIERLERLIGRDLSAWK